MNTKCYRLALPRRLQRLPIRLFFILALGISQGNLVLGELPDAKDFGGSGIRTLRGQHITLFTDLPSQRSVDELPQVFDLAVPQWAVFFGIANATLKDWHVTACVMQNKQRFLDYGLLPPDLPDFSYGFQKVDRVWVLDQPGDYYRRHLLLHEGTHAVMNRIFGRVGPAWYREGIAELVATHRYENGQLTLTHFPTNKKHVEHWGRIRVVADQVREGKGRSIRSIVDARTRDFLQVEAYAWCWALQSFGHHHPDLQALFRSLSKEMHFSSDSVTRRFLQAYEAKRFDIDLAWNLFLHHLDYGYHSTEERIVPAAGSRPLRRQPDQIRIRSDRGWQSSGITLAPNAVVQVVANGSFQIAQDPQPWISEPQGVTISYYQGRPLGVLLAAVVDKNPTALSKPIEIGRRGEFQSITGGTLYFRINERADKLLDNRGHIDVYVRAAPTTSNAALGL